MALQKLKLFDMLTMMAVMIIIAIIIISSSSVTSQENCSDACGSVEIPYPFGVSPGCYYDSLFKLICNTSFDPPKLQFPDSEVSILNISLEQSEIRIDALTARDCYNELGNLTEDSNSFSWTITGSMYPVSTRNKFTAVGCDTVGIIGGNRGRWYATGCVSLCNKTSDLVNGSCSGLGCCQMDVPEEVWDFLAISVSLNHRNHTRVHDFNPCGFAFLAEEGSYNFSSLDLLDLQKRKSFPVVLDWAIGNSTCDEARRNATAYACKARNSECLNAVNGPGHRCKCSRGFYGNPYLFDGCQDMDECETSNNPCKMMCKNLEGSYKCLCPKGFKGDGETNGTGCTKIDAHSYNSAAKLSISLGVCTVVLIIIVGSSWTYWGVKKRSLIKLKQKFFEQNGGLLLQQKLLSRTNGSGGSTEIGKIFTDQELKTATNNFDETRIVGQGGYGTVYKGILADKKVVAIKKSKICDQSQMEQFINEVVVLLQVNHRNVVKLLGFCLETEVPLLVYEFITNGTLSDHVQSLVQRGLLSWEMRLKIATETASAIAYLHSSASVPIIHRDIKSANILLDENYTAKVSDFGASRLVPIDQTKLNTLVQGTLGYLDPEYFHTSQLTEKSDVYSFGVVLAEILTGQKALSLERTESNRNLALYFISSVKSGQLLQILDKKVATEENMIREIEEVADLAQRCLRVRGEERPSMKEVARELEELLFKDVRIHPYDRNQVRDFTPEEADYLLRSSNLYSGNIDSCSNEITLDNSYHQGR